VKSRSEVVLIHQATMV